MKRLKNIVYLIALCVLVAPSFVMAQAAFNDPADVGGGSGPNLVPSAVTVDGGKLPIGGSAQIVALFTNSGGEPVMVRDINLYPSSSVTAEVASNQCSVAPLPGGAECAVTISVVALQPGSWRVEVLAGHSGQSRLATTTITGSVDAGEIGAAGGRKDLRIDPELIDFGSLSGRSPLVRSTILTNSTSKPITVDDIILDASSQTGFELETDCSVLDPGQGCIAKVKWTPKNEGPAQGVLVVKHTGASRVSQIELKGIYAPSSISEPNPWPDSAPGEGLLVADQKEIDFGDEVDGAAAISLSLINLGDKDVVLDLIRLAGSDNGLSLARDGCRMGVVLAPTEACVLTLNWLPRREGPIIDSIQVLHSGARGVLILPIRGEAETPVSASAKQTITKERDGELIEIGVTTPTMDGYTITSHSKTKAIIAGPTGSRVIRDGEMIVLEGFEWVTKIVPSGVELVGEFDRVLLVFDRALGPQSVRTPGLANPIEGNSTNSGN